MQRIEDLIKRNGRKTEEELPEGHRQRFENLLEEKLPSNCAKFQQKRWRIVGISTITSAAIFLLLIAIISPSKDEIIEREIATMRQELIDNNLKELERLHNSILCIAKEKLPAEDYIELQQSINEMHENYLAIIDLADSIPPDKFRSIMVKSMNTNILIYNKINHQLAIR